jgi:hypothetical protein
MAAKSTIDTVKIVNHCHFGSPGPDLRLALTIELLASSVLLSSIFGFLGIMLYAAVKIAL